MSSAGGIDQRIAEIGARLDAIQKTVERLERRQDEREDDFRRTEAATRAIRRTEPSYSSRNGNGWRGQTSQVIRA